MEETGRKTGGFFSTFVNSCGCLSVRFVVGVVLMAVKPDLIQQAVPFNLRKNIRPVEGTVIAKGREEKRLLLTVNTPEGVVLATFTRRVPEIDLLVERGDLITLGLPEYSPFVTDPELRRVRKPKIKVRDDRIDVIPQGPAPQEQSNETTP